MPLAHLGERAANRTCGGLGATLCEPQEREAGLRLQGRAGSQPDTPARPRHPAAEPVKLALAIERLRRSGPVEAVREPLAGTLGLSQCVTPTDRLAA